MPSLRHRDRVSATATRCHQPAASLFSVASVSVMTRTLAPSESAGAPTTTTIDMSNTYLDWARRNMTLNGFNTAEHQFIRADCVEWLKQGGDGTQYGLIFLDPPSFSTSKRMDATLDLQRDHVNLIRDAVKLLEPKGVLIFSNNLRRFRMDLAQLDDLQMEDISRATLPNDFQRNPRIHNVWRISTRETISAAPYGARTS